MSCKIYNAEFFCALFVLPHRKMANLIDSEVLQAFITYATIVLLKMLLMAPMTAYFRITRKVQYLGISVL